MDSSGKTALAALLIAYNLGLVIYFVQQIVWEFIRSSLDLLPDVRSGDALPTFLRLLSFAAPCGRPRGR